MFSQVLDTCIHKFHSIKSTSSELRACRRMGCLTIEAIDDLIVCQRTSHRNQILITRMPCHCKVQLIEHAISRHKTLSGSAFLARTAKEYNCSLFLILLQILFYRNCSSNGTCSEKVVSTSMSRRAVFHCDFFQTLRLLTKSRQRIKLTENTYYRLAKAVCT